MPVESVISSISTASIGTGAISSTTFASGAINAAAVAPEAIGASELAADAVTKIVTNLGGMFANKGITYTGATSYAAFTVTGPVAVKVAGSVTSALTNHADTTSVGTATSAAGLIAATAATAMQTIGQIWVDNAPAKLKAFPSDWIVVSESIVVASTANIAGGTLMLNCWWFPVVAGSTLVAA